MLALVVVIVVLLVGGAVAAVVAQARHTGEDVARARALSVAETFSRSPGLLTALRSPDPSARLEPVTRETQRDARVDYIVVTNTQGIRYTHPDPGYIGKRVSGPLYPATAGRSFTDMVPGHTLKSPSIRAAVPVFDARGRVVAVVNAGVTVADTSATVNRQLPPVLGGGAGALAASVGGVTVVSRRLRRQTHGLGPAEITRMYEHHDAVLHAVREGVLIVARDGRLLLANDEARRLLNLPADAQRRPVAELGLGGPLTRLLTEGRVATDEVHRSADRFLAVNQQPTRVGGRTVGTVVTLRDTTELRTLAGAATEARERLKLLYDASVSVGTTLDLPRTAEELAQAALPRFADLVTVDLFESMAHGEEPPLTKDGLRRMATAAANGQRPLYETGRLVRYSTGSPQSRSLTHGQSSLVPDLSVDPGRRFREPAHGRWVVDQGIRSLITVPLRARGTVLGVTSFYRQTGRAPYDAEDLSIAEELVGHAAVCVDNARRYAREHATAVSLQRSLLPGDLPEQNAVRAACRYVPARSGVGGDWFDVIPLSGARVALVVGDVVGHGLHAAATMGRLRTAVLNFSALDLAPDELLTHLDELVIRLDQEEGRRGREPEPGAAGGADDAGTGFMGATCLYAIYDPVSRYCALARAGHPAPAVVRPDGGVAFPEVPGGPPLGLGGFPFETYGMRLAEDSDIVLFTDGLLGNPEHDIGAGLERLRQALAGPAPAARTGPAGRWGPAASTEPTGRTEPTGPGAVPARPAEPTETAARSPVRSPEETCDAVLEALLPVGPNRPEDDVALLVARTRALDAEHVVVREVSDDPVVVARVRADVTGTLSSWGLESVTFTTELIASELITNAIRYATAPIHLRLIRNDTVLICEVSDGSSTSPHLRRSTMSDEGGRGLFLVAQLAQSWGTRYTARGKTIWAEQPLAPAQSAEPVAFAGLAAFPDLADLVTDAAEPTEPTEPTEWTGQPGPTGPDAPGPS
ncbi:SpoIIE family protein phosphatase [Streptomyces sp. NPDC004749]